MVHYRFSILPKKCPALYIFPHFWRLQHSDCNQPPSPSQCYSYMHSSTKGAIKGVDKDASLLSCCTQGGLTTIPSFSKDADMSNDRSLSTLHRNAQQWLFGQREVGLGNVKNHATHQLTPHGHNGRTRQGATLAEYNLMTRRDRTRRASFPTRSTSERAT